MTLHQCFAGIDVSKSSLDVFIGVDGCGRSSHIANTDRAAAALAAELKAVNAFAVFEATGRYDRVLQDALTAACVPFARVNPGRARYFARSKGRFAKTDKIDAKMLAAFGKA